MVIALCISSYVLDKHVEIFLDGGDIEYPTIACRVCQKAQREVAD